MVLYSAHSSSNSLSHTPFMLQDCLVPKKYPQDPKLASWVETQRNLYNREYKQTKSKPDSGTSSNEDSPPPSTVAAMPRAKTPEEWAEDMEKAATAMEDGVEAAAMEVVNEVTAADDGGGKPAAVDYMAASPTNKRLTQERINMLNALGFVWSLRSKRTDDHWDDMFRQLVEYKEKHGVRNEWLTLLNDGWKLQSFTTFLTLCCTLLYCNTGLSCAFTIRREFQAWQVGRDSTLRVHQASESDWTKG